MALLRMKRTLEELDADQSMKTPAAQCFVACLKPHQMMFRHFRWMCLEMVMTDAAWLGLFPRRMLATNASEAVIATHYEALVMSKPLRILASVLRKMGVTRELIDLIQDFLIVEIADPYVYIEY